MMQAYVESGFTERAVFEFFVRSLPENRNFLVAAGLQPAVDFLREARFTDAELAWLRETGRFKPDFVDYLADLRFAGDVDAVSEGTVVLPNEPVLRVEAPLPVAQLLETRIINLMQVSILVASKAARMTLAMPDARLVDFGLRRAHGGDAGLLGARAAYVSGFAATATVPAGRIWDIPIMGTMAHSFVEAHDDEMTAFENFVRARPEEGVLLIDTYDTLQGARNVVKLAPRLAELGIPLKGVRIDSGDLGALARQVRQILDAGGLSDVAIFASGGLDEWKLEGFRRDGSPIDGYGIGTALTTSSDAPALDCAYKLQVYGGRLRRKLSSGKATWPGRKQVWRRYDDQGTMCGDTLALADEPEPARGGEALLHPVMRNGAPVASRPDLAAIRDHAAAQRAALPAALCGLDRAQADYDVTVSPRLQQAADTLAAEIAARNR
jgi:nicotinate phosphoribosyltransferase